jgi:hypothetical protein
LLPREGKIYFVTQEKGDLLCVPQRKGRVTTPYPRKDAQSCISEEKEQEKRGSFSGGRMNGKINGNMDYGQKRNRKQQYTSAITVEQRRSQVIF